MAIETQQLDFIETHQGVLSPEQAAQLLEMDEGDTGGNPDQAVAPDTAPEPQDEEPEQGDDEQDPQEPEAEQAAAEGEEDDRAEVDESQLNPDNTVILAKDGKHTIDYQKLLDARKAEQHWRDQAEATQQELARLQAQAQARANTGEAPTAMDNQVAAAQAAIDEGVSPDIFGDFSEESLAKGIQTLIDQQVSARVEAIVSQKLQPLEQKHANDAHQAHYQAIYDAHPDADSIVESKDLQEWIAAQPRLLQGTYHDALERGSAQDVIEVFDAFKKDSDEPDQAPPAKVDAKSVRDQAKAVIAKQEKAPPSSLSDIPGGRPAGQTRFEQLAETSDPMELLSAMDNMTPEQIEAHLNRLV